MAAKTRTRLRYAVCRYPSFATTAEKGRNAIRLER